MLKLGTFDCYVFNLYLELFCLLNIIEIIQVKFLKLFKQIFKTSDLFYNITKIKTLMI